MKFSNSVFFMNRKYSRIKTLKMLPAASSQNMLDNQTVYSKDFMFLLSEIFAYGLHRIVHNRPFLVCFLGDWDVFMLFI